jgi:hypothetical protein
VIDTAVQAENINFPTVAKRVYAAMNRLNRRANKHGAVAADSVGTRRMPTRQCESASK